MLRLTLFGGLRIEAHGGPLEGRATQRRRLALLALLASPPGRRVARDKLTAFLFPDASDQRARHNLSSALFDLRAELGEDVILGYGGELALNPEALPTDVARFVSSIEAGDLMNAVSAYAGPFLDGFFVDDAEEFERWVDGERERYSRQYVQALLHVAEGHSAAGDCLAAADAWHRLAVADPYSARVAVGYMNALEASGDRAGGLRFARVHEALLREELGAVPSPEVLEVAERLRNEPAAAALDVPRPSAENAPRSATVPAAESDVGDDPAVRLDRSSPGAGEPGIGVGVMPFQNLGAALDVDFGAGLTEEIITGLSRVKSLRIPSRTTIIAYHTRGVAAQVVGQELGVRYLVEGTVRSEDTRLRITAALVDTGTGSRVWSDQFDLRMAGVFEAQEQIAQAVVGSVAPHLAGTVGPLVDSTTRDPQAYRLYMRGRAAWYRRGPGDPQAALAFFQQALALDPDYALAYSAIADVYNVLGTHDYGLASPTETSPVAREAAERALRLNPELPEAHAALGNVLFNHDWDLGAAERLYRRAIRLNPGYGMVRHWLSLLLATAGRPEEALREIQAARDLDPRSPVLGTSLARHHYFHGAHTRAVEHFYDAIELDPTYVQAYLGAGLAWIQLGEIGRALADYERAAAVIGMSHSATLALAGHAEGLAGRTDRAIRIRDQLVALRAAGTYVAPHYMALVSLGLGDAPTALDLFEESLAERSAAVVYARIDPVVNQLRSEPRFQAILRATSPLSPQPVSTTPLSRSQSPAEL
jgi:DNA-binding SARP family transcriptional activator/TolB-like protein/Tfp pilus assembly protein PilF